MSQLLLFAVFFVWGISLTPLSILISVHFGLIDVPDARKVHKKPIPRGAGLVLWTGFLLWSLLFTQNSTQMQVIATGATMVFFAGYLDDMVSQSPWSRLFVHFAAAALVVWILGIHEPSLILLYLFWIAGTTNSYNLIDGMNGLALAMASIALLFLNFYWNLGIGVSLLPLVAMSLGMLPWNFPVARTFVGDGGVYLLGYLVGTFSAIHMQQLQISLPVRVMALFFMGGVPVIDTITAIIRRLATGKSPFKPDRGHIHHRLLDSGLGLSCTLLLLCLLQCLSLWTAHFLCKQ